MFQRGCVAHQVFYWRNVRQRFWLPIYDMVLGLQWHLETRANYPCLLPEIETIFWSLFMTCRDVSWLVLSSLFWFDSAADPGEGLPPPLIFRPKWRPKGRKKFFGDRPPPPLILGSGWPPPPLLIWCSGSATVIKNREELEHSATQHHEDNRTDSLALLWLVNINSEDKWGTTGTSQSDPFNNDLWSITWCFLVGR